jgi:hypothetical protein
LLHSLLAPVRGLLVRESGWDFDEGRPAPELRGGDTIAADRNVAHEDVRLAAHDGLNSDIARGSVLCQKSTPASRPNTAGYFRGRSDHQPLTARQFSRLFKKAAKAAELRKTVSLHSLRHSFAANLLEF